MSRSYFFLSSHLSILLAVDIAVFTADRKFLQPPMHLPSISLCMWALLHDLCVSVNRDVGGRALNPR